MFPYKYTTKFINSYLLGTRELPLSVLIPSSMERWCNQMRIAVQTSRGEVQTPRNPNPTKTIICTSYPVKPNSPNQNPARFWLRKIRNVRVIL